MKVLVCGGRKFSDAELLFFVLDEIRPSIVVHGAAKGADALADLWARKRGVPCRRYFAQWLKYGNLAGVLRNQRMLDMEQPDLVVAFPGGRGTADMVRRAKSAGVPVREVLPRQAA